MNDKMYNMNGAGGNAWRDGLVAACLFWTPATNLVVHHGSGIGFFLLLAISLYTAYQRRNDATYFAPLRRYRIFTVAMAALLVVVLAQEVVQHAWRPREFDAPSRFVLALPIFLLLCDVRVRHLKAIGWGCAAGAVGAAVWAVIDRPAAGWTDMVRLGNYYTNQIPFGDTALLLAFLSASTLGWDDGRGRTLAWIAKGAALVTGIDLSYLSGSRGGWIAIPLLVALLAFEYRWFSDWKRLASAVLIVIVAVTAALSTERVQSRIAAARSDVALFQHGSKDTSIGLRLQLWRASIRLFRAHPVWGVGKGRLTGAFGALAKRGEVDPAIVNARAHSDFFSALAEAGVVGAAGLLFFYAGTAAAFWRNRRSDDRVIRTASCAGLSATLSTVIFGLTIDVLVPIMEVTLLALMYASLLAMIEARRRELAGSVADGPSFRDDTGCCSSGRANLV